VTQLIESIGATRAWSREQRGAGRSVGFVATQGCLHEGHGALIDAAKSRDDVVVVSVFVNPLQFYPEGYAAYPRTLDADVELAEARGADVVFAPSVEEMYPGSGDPGGLAAMTKGVDGADDGVFVSARSVVEGAEEAVPLIRVPTRLSMKMDGKLHPWHFDGVATVVARLFDVVAPDRAYFGVKDTQQLAILEAMNGWLGSEIEIVRVPIVRDPDGLASSSRLSQLDGAQRKRAARFVRAFLGVQKRIDSGERDMVGIARSIRDHADVVGGIGVDSIDIVDPLTLEPVREIVDRAVVYGAYVIDGVRIQECVEVSVGGG